MVSRYKAKGYFEWKVISVLRAYIGLTDVRGSEFHKVVYACITGYVICERTKGTGTALMAYTEGLVL